MIVPGMLLSTLPESLGGSVWDRWDIDDMSARCTTYIKDAGELFLVLGYQHRPGMLSMVLVVGSGPVVGWVWEGYLREVTDVAR